MDIYIYEYMYKERERNTCIYTEREASDKHVERDMCIRLVQSFSWIPLQPHLPAPGHPAFHDLIISILD